jgi:hypothetical protein
MFYSCTRFILKILDNFPLTAYYYEWQDHFGVIIRKITFLKFFNLEYFF